MPLNVTSVQYLDSEGRELRVGDIVSHYDSTGTLLLRNATIVALGPAYGAENRFADVLCPSCRSNSSVIHCSRFTRSELANGYKITLERRSNTVTSNQTPLTPLNQAPSSLENQMPIQSENNNAWNPRYDNSTETIQVGDEVRTVGSYGDEACGIVVLLDEDRMHIYVMDPNEEGRQGIVVQGRRSKKLRYENREWALVNRKEQTMSNNENSEDKEDKYAVYDGEKFRVGDRVYVHSAVAVGGSLNYVAAEYCIGTVVNLLEKDGGFICDVSRDDGVLGGGKNSSWRCFKSESILRHARAEDKEPSKLVFGEKVYKGDAVRVTYRIGEMCVGKIVSLNPLRYNIPNFNGRENGEYTIEYSDSGQFLEKITHEELASIRQQPNQDPHHSCNRCNNEARVKAYSLKQPFTKKNWDNDPTWCGVCYTCDGHCSCPKCVQCGTKARNLCGDCSKCRSHCVCVRCEFCNVNISNLRPGQDCRCVVNRTYEPKSPIPATLKDRKYFNSTRYVGVEWEYNNSKNEKIIHAWANKWGAGRHRDGSCGWELVTPPIAGDHVVNCLSELQTAFEESKAECNYTCGIHVHVDASDYGWPEMQRLLTVYAKVEPLLYLLAGQFRLANTYCMPAGQAYLSALSNKDKKEAIMNVAYKQSKAREYVKAAKPGKKHGGRYRGLNICPWLVARRVKRKDNTVEFRIHRNTLDAKRVIGWVKLLSRLVEWCSKATDSDIEKLPNSVIRTMITIAPDCKDWILDRIWQWRACTRTRKYPNGPPAGETRTRRRIGFLPGGRLIAKDLPHAYEEKDTVDTPKDKPKKGAAREEYVRRAIASQVNYGYSLRDSSNMQWVIVDSLTINR